MPHLVYPRFNFPGAADGSSGAAGTVGEIIQSVQSSALGSGFTIGQFGNITTISLTPGDWMVGGQVSASFLAALTRNVVAISAFSANTTTDHVTGDNVLDCPLGVTGALSGSVSLTPWHVTISAAATYYLKSQLTGAVGNVLTGRLTATRIR